MRRKGCIQQDFEIIRKANAVIREGATIGDLIELAQQFAEPDEGPVISSEAAELGAIGGALWAIESAIEDIGVRGRKIERLDRIRRELFGEQGKRIYPEVW